MCEESNKQVSEGKRTFSETFSRNEAKASLFSDFWCVTALEGRVTAAFFLESAEFVIV